LSEAIFQLIPFVRSTGLIADESGRRVMSLEVIHCGEACTNGKETANNAADDCVSTIAGKGY
jgi:hypothetical protein